MDEVRLSAYERRVLAEIEEELSADDHLARRMAGRRPSLRPRLPRPRLPRHRITVRGGPAAAVLGAATLTLLVLAVATSTPALIWGFAAAWMLTLILLLRLVLRWTRRRADVGRPDA
ncbi:DUF3040 domain-containing protein [Streptomyces hydrogenans]|uniref:DUF3040 domain-containing protein n=1 Tax=Streptomyces hydrogenans TaxID=1873719 RepID=A0ABQ3PM36_9ACTN|nr:DUF3040 domain-containing protein [Streptomyces hydrogenans]GHF96385.1 hypothetical protein GCM10018784_04750 [Streptomyces hydrogenans]GHI26085.1 hypothetical protein Shyd_74560 [Streptomyces hydrogenans]